MISPISVRFTGETNASKRLKSSKKAEEKRMKAEQVGTVKPSRQERIAAFKAKQKALQKELADQYKAALEKYLVDPEPVHQLLKSPVYTDEQGDFTVQDMIKVMKKEQTRQKAILYPVLGLAFAMILPVALAYASAYWDHGHENIVRLQGTSAGLLLDRFPKSQRNAAWDKMLALRDHGLISLQTEGAITLYNFTDLGKRLMK